ncbi:hypothetical protein ACQKEU_28160, partial [Acidovorax sp. NPDC077664]|uniref:hypothetical protein n=1 Tax=Acidovorax sp. NPDC077664 TaxID=3390544 RepID=UPI003D00C873
MLKKTTRGRYPAPEAALAAMVEGAMVDYDTALRIESRYLARLMTGPVARARSRAGPDESMDVTCPSADAPPARMPASA